MKLLNWIKERIKHKLEHLKFQHLVETFKKHGAALVTIIIVWEVIEDIGFPLLFIWLGKNVHPAFIAGAPASWLLCLHWLVVPLAWNLWIKFTNYRKKKDKYSLNENCLDNSCELSDKQLEGVAGGMSAEVFNIWRIDLINKAAKNKDE
jgi:hypothetical protein